MRRFYRDSTSAGMFDRYRRGLLVSGTTIGEGIAVGVMITVILFLAARGATDWVVRVQALDAIALSSGAKASWTEHWAVNGVPMAVRMPDAVSGRTGAPPTLSGISDSLGVPPLARIHAIETTPTAGSFVFRYGSGALAGGRLQFRPYFGPGEEPATIGWVCGRAMPASGFRRAGDDATTIPDSMLPSPCRSPR